MPGIIEFPKLVQDALDQFGDLFANCRQGKRDVNSRVARAPVAGNHARPEDADGVA